MNPITNAKNLQKLNQRELELGIVGRNKKSWHDEYKDSAWIFIGGLPYDLTEGDVVCVFSQYGEVVNINLVRDKATGKSKGFAFLCYEDQRSTILAVDNLNTIKLLGRIIRVDHVADYKKPKEKGDEDEMTLKLRAEGCAPKVPEPLASAQSPQEPPAAPMKAKKSKDKKKKKKKKKRKKKMKVTVKVEQPSDGDSSSDDDSSDEDGDDDDVEHKHKRRGAPLPADGVKREKVDHGYEGALHGHQRALQFGGGRDYKEDVKPRISETPPPHSGRQPHPHQHTDPHKVHIKAEPSDSGSHRQDKVKERGEERFEPRHAHRDDDRERRRHNDRDRHRDDDRDRHRDDDRDRRRDDRDRRDRHHRDDHRDNRRDVEDYDRRRR
ncbi:uncharacterized protein LOC143289200 [Babylonia areolata]|uniref:uncharacterized protein LOC143289200 n=1 Tax=Babylonia areolata TaxID=304850 RepID=UPI003FD52E6E